METHRSQRIFLSPSLSIMASLPAAEAGTTTGSTRPRALCLYVFDRAGTALHYAEWDRPKSVRARGGAGTPADDAKMMFGLLFSLRTLAAAVDPLRSEREREKRAREREREREAVQRRRCVFSTRSPFSIFLSPTKQQLGAPLRIGDGCSFRSFTTNNYKLHALESPSGLKVKREERWGCASVQARETS